MKTWFPTIGVTLLLAWQVYQYFFGFGTVLLKMQCHLQANQDPNHITMVCFKR